MNNFSSPPADVHRTLHADCSVRHDSKLGTVVGSCNCYAVVGNESLRALTL
jgi:hypothetical protein